MVYYVVHTSGTTGGLGPRLLAPLQTDLKTAERLAKHFKKKHPSSQVSRVFSDTRPDFIFTDVGHRFIGAFTGLARDAYPELFKRSPRGGCLYKVTVEEAIPTKKQEPKKIPTKKGKARAQVSPLRAFQRKAN